MFDVVEWLNQRIPFPIFFTFRLLFAWVTVIFGVLWALYGYDATTGTMSTGKVGIGIHLSTFQLLGFGTWVIMTNLQLGGFRTLRQVAHEFWNDLKNIRFFALNRDDSRLYVARRGEYIARWGDERLRAIASRNKPAIDPFRTFLFTIFLGLGVFFVFEVPYILLHDYFNYGGDPWWPIYAFVGPGEITVIGRNFYFLALTGLPPLILWSDATLRWRYRFDKKWGVMVAACLGLWLFWVFYPFPHAMGTFEVEGNMVDSYVGGEFYETRIFDRNVEELTWPLQQRFPQTVYTYYIVGEGEPYRGADDMGEFYVDDVGIRTVNLLLKYLVFLVVAYPMLVRVEEL